MLSAKEHVSTSMYESVRDTVEQLKVNAAAAEPVNIMQLLTDKCTSILRLTLFGVDGVTEEQVREINGYYSGIVGCQTAINLLLAGNLAR